MAGYSGTPLLKKLGVKEGHRVLLRNPPQELPEELLAFRNIEPNSALDVVVLFAQSASVFEVEFEKLQRKICPEGAIWVAWPKKASGIQTDLNENAIRNHALRSIFVDVKVCAIDETWSGLKLVIRKEHRAALAATS